MLGQQNIIESAVCDALIFCKVQSHAFTDNCITANFAHGSRWVMGALSEMAKPSGKAADILASYGCTGCTDVTGFGLLGHLVEMTKPSQVSIPGRLCALSPLPYSRVQIAAVAALSLPLGAHGSPWAYHALPYTVHAELFMLKVTPQVHAELFMQSVPLLSGAQDTLTAGVTSSLHAQNARAAASVHNFDQVREFQGGPCKSTEMKDSSNLTFTSSSDAALSTEQHRYNAFKKVLQKHPQLWPILVDPQTGGGLLAGVAWEKAEACVQLVLEGPEGFLGQSIYTGGFDVSWDASVSFGESAVIMCRALTCAELAFCPAVRAILHGALTVKVAEAKPKCVKILGQNLAGAFIALYPGSTTASVQKGKERVITLNCGYY
eukprot:1149783-Pelagomonas_calceolata.AAC.3